MKRLCFAVVLAAALSAQVERPLAGVAVRDGRLEAFDGVMGAARIRVLRDGVKNALATRHGIAVKSAGRVELLDGQGNELGGVAADDGEALFAEARDGRRVFVLFVESGRAGWIEWKPDEGVVWRDAFHWTAGPAPRAVWTDGGQRIRFALRDEAGVRVADVDAASGALVSEELMEGVTTPAVFGSDGQLVFAPDGADSVERLNEEWYLLRQGGSLTAWKPSGERLLLPTAADPLVLTWRKTLSEEIAVGDSFEFPAPGEYRFRVKNTSSGVVRVFRLVTDGSAFQLFNEFIVPKDIVPDGTSEFWIRYNPPAGETPVGRLRLNDRSVELRGGAAAVTLPEVWYKEQWTALSANAANRVGDAERDVPFSARLRMRATAGEPETPTVSGGGFTLAAQGGGEYLLQLTASVSGMAEGQLTVSGRTYPLQVFVFEPAPPRPSLKVSGESLDYAKQMPVEVLLSEPAKADATGLLTISFQSEAAGAKDDGTLGFLPALGRAVSFTVEKGATKGKFSGAESLSLQTGTTAGTVTITATLGGVKDERKFRLAPAAPGLQTAAVQGLDQRVTLRVTGYDPMRNAGKAAFTFYLKNGQAAAPGRIEADVASVFRNYYAETATTSGAFVLHAQFPVTGTLSELAAVEVELANSEGTARTQRLAIQ